VTWIWPDCVGQPALWVNTGCATANAPIPATGEVVGTNVDDTCTADAKAIGKIARPLKDYESRDVVFLRVVSNKWISWRREVRILSRILFRDLPLAQPFGPPSPETASPHVVFSLGLNRGLCGLTADHVVEQLSAA